MCMSPRCPAPHGVPGDLRCILPTRFCRRFLLLPGPPFHSTGRLRGPSGGPLGAGSRECGQTTTLRCRGPWGRPSGCPISCAHSPFYVTPQGPCWPTGSPISRPTPPPGPRLSHPWPTRGGGGGRCLGVAAGAVPPSPHHRRVPRPPTTQCSWEVPLMPLKDGPVRAGQRAPRPPVAVPAPPPKRLTGAVRQTLHGNVGRRVRAGPLRRVRDTAPRRVTANAEGLRTARALARGCGGEGGRVFGLCHSAALGPSAVAGACRANSPGP